jgi:DNA polymerase
MPDEIRACGPYLSLQLKTIDPLMIVTLGRFAMHYFYKDGTISNNRGKLLKAEKYYIYPVYHPAAGLRNPTMLRNLEEDFIRIPSVLEDIRKGSSNLAVNEEIDDGQLSLFC